MTNAPFDNLEPRRLLAAPVYLAAAAPRGEMLSDLAGAEYSAVQNLRDGKLLAVTVRDRNILVLSRHLPTGKLDTSFGEGGLLTRPFRDGIVLNHVRALPGGKFLATGSIGDPALIADGDDNVLLLRFNAKGLLDPAFGTAGMTSISFAKDTYETGTFLDVTPQGRIILSGRLDTHSADTSHALFAAFTPTGKLDTAFGTAGRIRLRVTSEKMSTSGTLRVLPDGKLLLEATYRTPRQALGRYVLSRLNSDGAYDTAFGKRGSAALPAAWGINQPRATILPDGRILLAGFRDTDDDDDARNDPLVLARLTSAGAIDQAFGKAGFITDPRLPARLQAGATPNVTSVGPVQPLANDRYLISLNGPSDFLLARFDSRTGLDPTFGLKGSITTPFDSRADSVTLVKPQRDGKILLAGVARDPDLPPYAAGWLARFTAAGLPDRRFGGIHHHRKFTEPMLINVPGRLHLFGTDDADEIRLFIDADTDSYSLDINGQTIASGVASHIFSTSVPGGGLSIDARRGDDAVTITSNANVPVTVSGGAGDDHLFGSRSDDLFFGGPGTDLLMGEGGRDTLVGDAGDDHLFGGDGDDTLYANDGNDTAEGNRGTNTIHTTPVTAPIFT